MDDQLFVHGTNSAGISHEGYSRVTGLRKGKASIDKPSVVGYLPRPIGGEPMLIRLFFVASLGLVLVGCASPRVVSAVPGSVVIAVPDNSNTWPMHYKDEALKKAREHVSDPVLVSVQQVKVGETVVNNQDSNKRDLGNGKKKFGELTTTTNTTSVRDEYEYYLEYRSKAPGTGASVIQQTGGVQPR